MISSSQHLAMVDISIVLPPRSRSRHRELTQKLNKTSIDFYLRTPAEQGFNVVQTVVLAELGGTTRANFYGDLPFNNSDTTQPNEA